MNKDLKFKFVWVESLKEPLFTQKSTEEMKALICGNWEYTPVDILVLYTKGTRRDVQQLFGKDNIHIVNTSRTSVMDATKGHYYKEIFVLDKNVKQWDIDLANKRLWKKDNE